MHNCNCTYSPTELTKFAPFDKYESGYSCNVPPGLKDIGVSCSSCKYFGIGKGVYLHVLEEGDSHCHVVDGLINSLGFCRFWTQKEEIEEYSSTSSNSSSKHSNDYDFLSNQDTTSEDFEQKVQDLLVKVINKSQPESRSE